MSTINAVGATSTAPHLEATFRQVVGTIFYGQLLKSLRQTVGKPAYLHGGSAEELFQAQLDQVVVENLAGQQGGPWIDELLQQFLVQLNQRTAAAQSAQLAQPAESRETTPQAELREVARQTQPAAHSAGMTTGATALSALIRK